MNFKTKSILVLATALVGTAAMAQTAPAAPESTLSFNIGAVSDYRFRSVSQTSFKPALQGGVDFAHASGAYIGAWASNVSWIKDYVGATDGTTEVDVYLGYKGAITSDLAFDIGVITYQYPGNTADKVLVNANTTEVYGALTYGIATVKYSQSTGNFIANPNSSGSAYLELAATFDLGGGFSLTPHVGRQTIPNNSTGDYTDFSLALGKDFGGGLTGALTAYSTDAKDSFYKVGTFDNLGKSGLAVGVKYSF
ncbi:MAG: TorF family putative porin [Burkholderiaceae bacterium]|nr:TorF family putative porin [Burkholderiaceae bacterium]